MAFAGLLGGGSEKSRDIERRVAQSAFSWPTS
jgi:hypothetical protein